MIQLLIADDHPIFRNGLKQIIAEEEGMEVKDEAPDGQTVLSLIKENQYDALVLDIDMKGMNGLEVLAKVRQTHPSLPVLILSFYSEEQYAVRSMKLGAAGYLTKESAVEQLVAAVRRIVTGHKYITPSVAERMVQRNEGDAGFRPHELLSEREYQVMWGIVEGKTIGEIASFLNISIKTVSTYKGRILDKMGLENDAQLVRYTINEGLMK